MRFLYLLIAVCWLFIVVRRMLGFLFRRLINSAARSAPSGTPDGETTATRRLVRDPECGVFISEERALPIKSGAQVLHFCSTACRDRYFLREHKMAANS